MSNAKQLPTRMEVPKELKWDLTKMFTSEGEFDKAYDSLLKELKLAEEVKQNIKKDAKQFLAGIEYVLDIARKLETIYIYAHQKNDQDTTNTKYQELYARAGSLLTKVTEASSWFEPEVLSISSVKIQEFFNEEPDLRKYTHFIDAITIGRKHILSEKEEALLAGASEIFRSSSQTFGILNNSDLKFPEIENEKGEKIQLSHGMYSQLMENPNRKVREAAYKGLYSVYQQFANTFSSTLGSHVKAHNYRAKVRKYTSAREAALSGNHISEEVYDTLVKVVNNNLPLLHRYVKLRKKLLKVEQLHMYDMYTPILGEVTMKFTYEEAKKRALAALQPLGNNYIKVVEQAFEQQWIDVVESQGKRSGAYSSGGYDTPPYILLNWHDSLDQLYTLVHEMGHSVHSYYTRSNQPYVYGDYSIFLAEIASTTNENILTEYLLETEKDPSVRAYILNHYLDGFKGTIFRQTQFVEFEQRIHEEDANGVPLTSEYLSQLYGEINSKYYGSEVENDTEIKVEWARIPHFYYNFYVYQYATGFSAASALSEKIVNNDREALEKYLHYLKSGSSDYPIEVMKKAGVDMTKSKYIEDAMKVFEKRLEELENLIEQLG